VRLRSGIWLRCQGPAARTSSGIRLADRGAAAVEMAFVLPLLLVLIFGIIDFGRMLNKQITITAAAQDGARVASLGGKLPAVTARVQAIAGSDVSVTAPETCATSDDAEVVITYDFTFVTPVGLMGGGFDGKATITGRGVMSCQ
jgi:Flp pilus assembly protein TadG